MKVWIIETADYPEQRYLEAVAASPDIAFKHVQGLHPLEKLTVTHGHYDGNKYVEDPTDAPRPNEQDFDIERENRSDVGYSVREYDLVGGSPVADELLMALPKATA